MAHSAGVINLAYFCFHAVVYWAHSAEIISELILKADARQQFFGCCCVSAVFIHVLPFPSPQEDDVWEGERDGSVHQGGGARAGCEEIQRYEMLALPFPSAWPLSPPHHFLCPHCVVLELASLCSEESRLRACEYKPGGEAGSVLRAKALRNI